MPPPAEESSRPFSNLKGRSSVDNLLRTAQQHHVQLSLMADMKANILITISSILLTIALARSNDPQLRPALLTLAAACLISLVLAIIAILPTFARRRSQRQNRNILFFGHFASMSEDEYLREMDEIPHVPPAPMVSRDPEVVAAYENDPLNYLGPMPRAMLDAFADIALVRDRLAEITVPVLVMHGGSDALVPAQAAEDIAKGVSSDDVTLKVWPELYHEIFNEPEQAEVIGTMIDWLGAHVDGGSARRREGEGA